MTPFRYSGFWDVPRGIVLRHRNHLLFMLSLFDEALDDYEPEYSVYLLPDSAEAKLLQGDWDFLTGSDAQLIGKVPVHAVNFDRTRRKELDASVLDIIVGGLKA